jgi:DNA-binding NtrC family response regulator
VSSKGTVFLLDDDELIVSMLARALTREGYRVQAETDPGGVVEKIRACAPDVVLLDIKLPGASGLDLLPSIIADGVARNVIMLTSDDTAETAVRAMKLGAVDYLTKPFNLEEVKIVVRNVVERGDLVREVDYLRRVSAELLERPLIGEHEAIRDLRKQAATLAKAGVQVVLLTGESGTGKEVLARYIHQLRHADRAGRPAPFIGINCTALPETLIESELFGHEKGAFTDAGSEKKGLFEMAAGGSLLLDEIGDMQPSMQSKLLRVLEERVVRHVGGSRDLPVSATVFATTNRTLEEQVERGKFRQDLFFRLNSFALDIPPLRERGDDVLLLARFFLEQFSKRYDRKRPAEFSAEVKRLLRAHRWPGNVRELKNTMERIVVLEGGDVILPEHLPKEVLGPAPRSTSSAGALISIPDEGLSLQEVEKSLIVQALEKTGGNKTRAAKLLGVTYDTLRYQVKKFGLE